MKTLIVNAVVALVFELLAPQVTQAQGTTYLSNLDHASSGSKPVGNNSWLAAYFRTGANITGYQLNSIQLAMTDASGNPGGLTVMIYTAVGVAGINPGISLGNLNGSLSPILGSIYTYTDNANITLSASTDYFIVLTSNTSIAAGAYGWSFTDATSVGLGGWGGNTSLSYSSNGSSWSFLSGTLAQYSITATPIPEPSAWALFLVGCGMFMCGWRNRKWA